MLWDNPEGWGGKGGGRGIQDGGHIVNQVADSRPYMAKNHHNIVR